MMGGVSNCEQKYYVTEEMTTIGVQTIELDNTDKRKNARLKDTEKIDTYRKM